MILLRESIKKHNNSLQNFENLTWKNVDFLSVHSLGLFRAFSLKTEITDEENQFFPAWVFIPL